MLEDVKEIIKFLAGMDKTKSLAAHKFYGMKDGMINYSTKPAWALNVANDAVRK